MFVDRAGVPGAGVLDEGGLPADHRHRHAPTRRSPTGQNQRAYYELCYSDTVPLYTAELLNLGKFPYKSSWIENDSEGKPQKQYDGNTAVRYMEYPVITGIYQYVSMALAKTYTALTKLVSLPVDRRGGDVLQHRGVGSGAGLVGDGVGDARGWRAGRIWDAALVAGSPILIFQVFTNFDALATAFATGALLAWARRKPALAGVLIGLGRGGQAVPAAAAAPAALLGLRTGRLREVGKTAVDGGRRVAGGQPAGDGRCSRGGGRSSSGSTPAAATTWTRCTTW